jgi:urease accessory protein
MTVVERIYRDEALPEGARLYRRDTLTLGWEDRVRGHGKRQSDGGTEFGTSLPRGTILRGGDCLVIEDARLIVSVVERPEPVVVIEPNTPQEWGTYAYQIGNRHQPVMITPSHLICPDTPGIEQLLTQQRIPFTRAQLPFTPLGTPSGHHHES